VAWVGRWSAAAVTTVYPAHPARRGATAQSVGPFRRSAAPVAPAGPVSPADPVRSELPRICFVVADPDVRQALVRVHERAGLSQPTWRTPQALAPGAVGADHDLLVLDLDAAGYAVEQGLRHRPGTVLVSDGPATPDLWRAALAVGAQHVVELPDGADWLLPMLAPASAVAMGPVVAVVGGCGGAGASTVAAGLAVAAPVDRPALLVDLDPWGAGLDALLGADDVPGARWEDLSHARGHVDAAALRSVLPTVAGVGVVTGRRGVPAEAPLDDVVAAVIAAGRSNGAPVVVDLPRRPVGDALPDDAQVLVVVPARVRAALAAQRLVAQLGRPVGQLHLVVRGPSPSGLDGSDVAAAVGVEQWSWLPPEARRAEADEHGVAPGLDRRSPLRALARRLLADAVPRL
jgi:secretion/DNA translocation related CpaE-like protein